MATQIVHITGTAIAGVPSKVEVHSCVVRHCLQKLKIDLETSFIWPLTRLCLTSAPYAADYFMLSNRLPRKVRFLDLAGKDVENLDQA